MKKILITGGNGLIGKKLCLSLAKKNFDVTSFDISEKDFDEKTIIKKYHGSILNPFDLDRAIKNADLVIHLAAMVGVYLTEKKPLECLEINIRGTKNVLDAAIKRNVKKIIFSSSSEIYGDQEKIPINERASLKPKSIYGVSKIVSEEYIKSYNKIYGLEFNICRFFNVIGPSQRDDFVTSKFASSIKSNKSLTINGDGAQLRAYCHVDDAAEGIMKIINKGKKNEIYNVGNPNNLISVKDLALKMINISKKKIKVKHISFNKSDRSEGREIFRRQPNISKLIKHTGFKPVINLSKALGEILKN